MCGRVVAGIGMIHERYTINEWASNRQLFLTVSHYEMARQEYGWRLNTVSAVKHIVCSH